MSNVSERYPERTSATTWLNSAAVLLLVFGIIAGLAIGTTSFGGDFYSSQATWYGWAFFAFGFAGFAFLSGLAAVVGRLTDIRYLLALKAQNNPVEIEELPSKSARPSVAVPLSTTTGTPCAPQRPFITPDP